MATWSRCGLLTACVCNVIRATHEWRRAPGVYLYLQTRGGHCGTAGAGLPNTSTPFSLSPSSLWFPPSLTPLQWSQQCCRDMPATLIIALGEERGMQQERERGKESKKESTHGVAGRWGWCWRIWHLFHSWWNSRSASHWCAYKETTT